MKRTPARRSSLFLLECIIAILFFILTAAICVSLFAKSYKISKDSEDLTMAVHITSSYVEEFRAGIDFPDETRLYFDENWMKCEDSLAAHTLIITTQAQDDIMSAHFAMDDIFETSLNTYVGGNH